MLGPEDPCADEVGRDQVRGELDAVERPAEHVGEGLHRQRLGEAGDALEQHVAAGEESDEHPLEHPFLPDDDPLHLEEGALELVAHVLAAPRQDQRSVGVSHAVAPFVSTCFRRESSSSGFDPG